ncbi:hypothetical protein IE81DRAFT_341094 [Ceraceosorus guamensis]|uniref:Pal1-domain-containing protein n=1 Tax=Ceraceosorus guamensis TaxID=1522189 RepID=A0A316W259_9BASI|nr:hypothetical protein IE81DRAFT_341094 [Ceraceosorus guamensis]PWN42853.1 hypothetical protein IE81DRAFT_341094 [Ceraceosorus guamensis]
MFSHIVSTALVVIIYAPLAAKAVPAHTSPLSATIRQLVARGTGASSLNHVVPFHGAGANFLNEAQVTFIDSNGNHHHFGSQDAPPIPEPPRRTQSLGVPKSGPMDGHERHASRRASLPGSLVTYRHNEISGGLKSLTSTSGSKSSSQSQVVQPPFDTPGYSEYLGKTRSKKNHEIHETWFRVPRSLSPIHREPGYGALTMGHPYRSEVESLSNVLKADQTETPMIHNGFKPPRPASTMSKRRLDDVPSPTFAAGSHVGGSRQHVTSKGGQVHHARRHVDTRYE